jgi:anti-anti-sigma regulatory factor
VTFGTDEPREVDFDLVTQEVGDGTFVVALTGEVDLYTAPELKAALLRLRRSSTRPRSVYCSARSSGCV